jgi:uncharacterized protein (TIGR02646 family)
MIKLSRPDKPQYLVDNEDAWAVGLTAAVEQFDGYKDIPKAQKESLTKHYRHDNIRLPLFAAAHDKCAYCECKPVVGGSYIQVEHFYPKSLYPEHCFDWHNFLPVCARCNLAKSNFDTKLTPIVNPYEDTPKEYLRVSLAKLKPLNDKGRVTIQQVNLNADRLIKIRTELMTDIQILTEDIAEQIILDDEDYLAAKAILTA